MWSHRFHIQHPPLSDPFRRFREDVAEAVQESIENDKRDRAHMSTKRHKREVIPRKRKSNVTASPLLTKMLEPVVDPHKKEREEEFRKNPFRGLDRYSR